MLNPEKHSFKHLHYPASDDDGDVWTLLGCNSVCVAPFHCLSLKCQMLLTAGLLQEQLGGKVKTCWVALNKILSGVLLITLKEL